MVGVLLLHAYPHSASLQFWQVGTVVDTENEVGSVDTENETPF